MKKADYESIVPSVHILLYKGTSENDRLVEGNDSHEDKII